MKKFLSFAAVSLLTSALLDPMLQSGLGKPVSWWRDAAMLVAGVICLYIMVKYRHDL